MRNVLRANWLSALAVALTLLVAAFFHYGSATRMVVDAPLRADARDYFFSAYNVAHFGVYSREMTLGRDPRAPPPRPDSVRSPGYPLLMLSLGIPRPERPYMQRLLLVQVALGVASVAIFFFIASSFLPPGWSHAATLLVALEPHLQIMSGYFLTETWFTFLLFTTIYFAIRAMRSERWPWFVAAGLACGLCSLTRPTLQLLPWLAVGTCLLVPALRTNWRHALLFLAMFLSVTLPWQVRSRNIPAAVDEPSLLVNFILHGSYPGFMYNDQPSSYGYAYRDDPNAKRASANVGAALLYLYDRAAAAPLRYATWFLVGKPGFFLAWSNIENPMGDIYVYPPIRTPYLEDWRFRLTHNLLFWLHWPLMLMGLGGVALAWRGEVRGMDPQGLRAARLTSFFLLYAVAFHMIGAPYPRYGVPFRPLLFAFAMLSVLILVRRTRGGAGDATGQNVT